MQADLAGGWLALVSCLAEVDKDLTSVERCLADSLILLAEQQVGDEKLWLLPQTQWQEGETLRQTAERALASLPGMSIFYVVLISNLSVFSLNSIYWHWIHFRFIVN